MTLKRLKRKEPHGQLCLPGTGSRALLLKTKRCSILREREGVSDGEKRGEMEREWKRGKETESGGDRGGRKDSRPRTRKRKEEEAMAF